MITLLLLLLQGIPEGIAITTLAFVISRIPLKLIQIVMVGITIAITASAIRLLPIPLGIHTIMVILILFIVLSWLSKGDLSQSLISTILSSLVLIIFETASSPLFGHISRLTPKALYPFQAPRIILGDIHVIILFLVAYLLNTFLSKKIT